jgi:hypothetical protein
MLFRGLRGTDAQENATAPEVNAAMKYRDLRDRLNAMPEDQLDYTATAYMRSLDKEVMFAIVALRLTDAEMIAASRRGSGDG